MKDRFNLRLYSEKRHEYVYINTIGYEDGRISYIDILDPSNELYAIEISVNDLGKDYVLEQCSGIRDECGQLIYEGDIVRWSFGNVLIKFSYDDVVSFAGLCGVDESIEIIGNIHKNPELLGGNKDER